MTPILTWRTGHPSFGLRVLDRVGLTRDGLAPFLENPEPHWRRVKVEKPNGGERVCWSPSNDLAELQELTFFTFRALVDLPVLQYATAFECERDIFVNAEAHRFGRSSIWLDLANAYEIVEARHIVLALRRFGVHRDDANVLARLWTFRGRLRQGPSIAPQLFNVMMDRHDRTLALTLQRGCFVLGLAPGAYTRYADDFCFSTSAERFPAEIQHAIFRVLHNEGLHWRGDKTRVGRYGVLEFPGVYIESGDIRPRIEYLQKLEGMLASSEGYLFALTEAEREGHRSFLRQFRSGETSPYLRNLI